MCIHSSAGKIRGDAFSGLASATNILIPLSKCKPQRHLYGPQWRGFDHLAEQFAANIAIRRHRSKKLSVVEGVEGFEPTRGAVAPLGSSTVPETLSVVAA